MKSDKVYFIHILKSIESILFYTKGLTEAEFFKNQLVIDAAIRNFESIVESVKRISSELRINHPNIP